MFEYTVYGNRKLKYSITVQVISYFNPLRLTCKQNTVLAVVGNCNRIFLSYIYYISYLWETELSHFNSVPGQRTAVEANKSSIFEQLESV